MGVTLTLFDRAPVDNSETIIISAQKISFEDPSGTLCEENYFFIVPFELDLSPFKCAPPPIAEFGSCCVTDNLELNACFEHASSELCDALAASSIFLDEPATFLLDQICTDDCQLNNPAVGCLSIILEEGNEPTCTGRIARETAIALSLIAFAQDTQAFKICNPINGLCE